MLGGVGVSAGSRFPDPFAKDPLEVSVLSVIRGGMGGSISQIGCRRIAFV